MKKQNLAQAIRRSLLMGAISGVFIQDAAMAQQGDDVEEQATITVTGSRIRTTDLEGPKPITVITREDIELSGFQTAADILRTTTFNSFGSFNERSGSSGGQAALVNMRGLGASRTAVLVNGRRLPGSALFGTSAANLNSLPIAAIERVDILQGGASSIYGADAIAGVINIILRDDYEGAEIQLGAARPRREGGDEENGSFVVGGSSDRGNYVFAAEFFRRDIVFDRDRDYSRVIVREPGGPFGNQTGISVGGNTGFTTNYSEAFAVGECQTTDSGGLYAGVFTQPFGIPGDGCGFGYADVSGLSGDTNRFNTFLNANYELNDEHALYFQNTVAKIQSFGRYAPAIGAITIDANAPLNDRGEDFILFHRFVGHGPRQENFVENDIDNVIGLNGVLFNSSVNYDAYFRSFTSNIQNIGNTYIDRAAMFAAILDGSYDFINPASPENAAAVAATAHTTSRDLRTRYNEAAMNFDGYGWDIFAGSIGWAVGAEWSSEDYQDEYDALREASGVIGSAGNSAAGGRERISVFGEVSVPLLDTLDMQLAARYDDYSDFGSEVSPSLSFRWQPLDNLLVRASYTEGFKAPNLTSLFSAQAESFNNVQDILQCNAQGIAPENCPVFQVRTLSGGNPDLNAELSEGFDVGVVWEPIDNLTLKVDYFETDLDDAISTISNATLLNLELQGLALPSGTSIIRGAPNGNVPGRILQINTGNANVSELNVSGMDVSIGYRLDTDSMGSFSASLQYSKLFDYIFTSLPAPLGTPSDLLNAAWTPDDRATLNGNWTYGNHTVSINSYWVDGFNNLAGNSNPGIASFVNHNLSYIYRAPWDADITVGVRNLLDRDPSIDPNANWQGNPFEPTLYDVFGRTPFVNYKQRF
ncbi:TonB-dependent receptor plug domain-containing protein [Marinicella sp. W31]|uniref:TonB-dependent receptor plug domain-containing protein n=1 Tax=Marinicella sp. W31 TaxID=3023713 RepID=UPI00375725ED